jgi:hypothetical protein
MNAACEPGSQLFHKPGKKEKAAHQEQSIGDDAVHIQ